ncbi:MAG: Dipeptidyl aminopeptidase BIII [Luteibacter sp.]|uniref:alpha/beta hydrolase family protein n=1 Tax=Luteibacter sp. TaxID=1886636 RepID=UPI00137F2D07|nr:S9 family peptidase [Luteibacter sp.]KAF1006913.1 MAG: Dipeptidyl aminopeptidase BIII [Luteibacter sp.]
MTQRLSAAQAVAAGADFTELAAGPEGLVFGRFDPADGATRLWIWRDGQARCLTPDGYSMRSRVYEYGGGSFCVAGSAVCFVNEKDQQVYRQALDAGAPERFGGIDEARHGDLVYDQAHERVLAVEEHDEGARLPVHRIIAMDARGQRQVLAEGTDFYASPRVANDGLSLAWIEWDRPHQPWTRTRLMRVALDGSGMPSGAPVVVAAGDESIQQPAFARNGDLIALTDRDGWWQPWRFPVHGAAMAIPSPQADHAGASWQLGAHTWLGLDDGRRFVTWFDKDFGRLSLLDGEDVHELAPSYTRFRAIAADERRLYAIAASATRSSTIIAIDRGTGELDIIAGGGSPLPDEDITPPQPITWPVVGARLRAIARKRAPTEAHGFLYLPRTTTPPPLLVFVHGGPTSATHPAFDPRIQFWTGQGFAVADVNYRGSTGYGRAYRDALRGAWGEADVDDVCSLVPWLAEQGLIDPKRAYIRGGSAGGYTVLCALAFRDVFRGGASLYGVSDPIALAKDTHKFEADYMDWLIGDPVADAAIYRERTPLLHAQDIDVPVIFFQGLRDAVVVPAQTEAMVAALRERGIPCEYHAYPEERHGFRQATTLAHALEHEHTFYTHLP